jgi:hypothetical protein
VFNVIRFHEPADAKGVSDAQESRNDLDQPFRARGRGLSAERLQYDVWGGKRHIRHRARNNEKRR